MKDPFLGLELKNSFIEVILLILCSYGLSKIGSFLIFNYFDILIESIPLYILYGIGIFWGHIFFKAVKPEKRNWDDYMRDFTAQSEYASYFLSAILIFFGLIADKSANLPIISKIYLNMSLFTSVMSIIFWPIDKPEGNDLRRVRALWIWKLFMLSASAFLAAGGIFITSF